MTEYCHPVQFRDRYQIVALSPEPDFDPADITGYAVLSPSGARLRHELTLEQARLWVDGLLQEENQRPAEPLPPGRAARRRP
ncbi:hypothetical protein DT603_06290 [Pseudoxanthomonas gei]|uniref:Uncharacterized protein n=1 Tax=Pseudoxanthomonas gei TaxID=1383030 RepID=A0ABX0AAE0_9GAMM|nr:hypothetical protein [Pseudoxanthomonas gei]NDK38451.1 hypothetical protein [Pseudoxanthomonas gei]